MIWEHQNRQGGLTESFGLCWLPNFPNSLGLTQNPSMTIRSTPTTESHHLDTATTPFHVKPTACHRETYILITTAVGTGQVCIKSKRILQIYIDMIEKHYVQMWLRMNSCMNVLMNVFKEWSLYDFKQVNRNMPVANSEKSSRNILKYRSDCIISTLFSITVTNLVI